jgi:hypothetical protein
MTTPLPVPTPPRQRRTPKPGDPLAVAIANGSLLGVGYAMLGRRVLAVLTALVSIALVVVLATSVRTLWLEIVVLVWWVALILHGWYLARRRPTLGTKAGKQRFIAIAVTLPVLLAFGLLRFDAARIDGNVADARADGDCATATSALDSRWFGHRVANAPLTEEGDKTVRACELLRTAGRELDTALSGDTGALRSGIGHLSTVLDDLPGHEKMVETTLGEFLDALPTKDACGTTDITDTLRDTRVKGMDRIADTVPTIAPAAMVTCADEHMAAEQWQPALDRYQQLLEEYPDHELAAKAQEGVTKATQAIELANVRQLLTLTGAGGQPEYCTSPAGYSAAAPYGAASPNRAMVFGDDHAGRLPPDWMAADAAGAVMVICAGEAQFGTPVETCSYEATPGSSIFTPVTFHRIAVPVRMFELKTGKLINDTRVEIGGASCPATIFGLENTRYVEPSDGDIHAAYSPLINP